MDIFSRDLSAAVAAVLALPAVEVLPDIRGGRGHQGLRRPRRSKRWPTHNGIRETARRKRQIASGSLRVENGLIATPPLFDAATGI